MVPPSRKCHSVKLSLVVSPCSLPCSCRRRTAAAALSHLSPPFAEGFLLPRPPSLDQPIQLPLKYVELLVLSSSTLTPKCYLPLVLCAVGVIKVSTVRSGDPLVAYLRGVRKGKQPYPDLVILSPGPGNPGDFGLSDTIEEVCQMTLTCRSAFRHSRCIFFPTNLHPAHRVVELSGDVGVRRWVMVDMFLRWGCALCDLPSAYIRSCLQDRPPGVHDSCKRTRSWFPIGMKGEKMLGAYHEKKFL